MKNNTLRTSFSLANVLFSFAVLFLFGAAAVISAQEPKPGPARSVNVPAANETTLDNGLTLAVVERRGVPLISVRLIVNSGYTSDELETAGLAQMTASLLTKGTTTRSAVEIANEIESLGGDIDTQVGSDSTAISVSVTSDKISAAMDVFSDIALWPSFRQPEIDLARARAIDELTYNLTQPGFLTSYVASVYSLYLTPPGGTPKSLAAIDREMITGFYEETFLPDRATLIFVGDIDSKRAVALAEQYFGKWKTPAKGSENEQIISIIESAEGLANRKKEFAARPLLNRILVIDLPNSGQASVSYVAHLPYNGMITWDEKADHGEYSTTYFPAGVMNSILGGGYSSRLNQEIRIKRGLSYGAGSAIAWRAYDSRLSTRTQTKNESAPEVAELVISELNRLKTEPVPAGELLSRKAVLVGNYGRSVETNSGIISLLSGLYDNWIPASELNSYINGVNGVTSQQIMELAANNITGGDIIIVGDYAKFKDDLAKRFPDTKVEVIKASELDITEDDLRKK